jgi:signal transduction histidine kinase
MITTLLEPVHCLLVDDLEENLLALEALLRREGVVLLKARSGRDALELLLQYDVALALVDVQMPEMDGFELAELMRGTERTRRVPIIFLTAGSAERQRRFRGYEAGAVDFLQKPLEPDILRSKADVFFDLYRQRQEVTRQRDELRAATEENARLLQESRKYAEALKRADLRKDEFLAMLAHELRNPLSAISNAVQLFKQSSSQEHHDWARQVIETQIQNLSRLIDDLLDVSRITRGKIRLKKQIVDVRPIIGHAVTSVSSLVQARRHELTIDYDHGETTLDVDPTRLEQMVANLLNNAAKYSENGGRIRLRTEIRDAKFIITVKDTGIGIEPVRLLTIFELFSQEDRSIARSEGGLGIGLTLVKKLVELHGGSVMAESNGIGRGSTFTLSLPVALGSPVVAMPGLEVKREQIDAVKLRILVVDDNVDTANAMGRLLELKGQEVTIAHDGPSAVELAKDLQPDVVILDIGLPDMNGYEVVETLRREGCCPDSYFIAITGYGQEQDRARSKEAGFTHHLVKPVDLDAVISILSGLSSPPKALA